jgi:thiamine-monophosphate kinase
VGVDERRVSEIGEFGLIAMLDAALPDEVRRGPALELGIGDDAAVWRPSTGASVVVTTDSLVEEIHFRLDWTDWESLGHKALAVNVSDLAAMGAAPKLAVVTLGLRGSERVADLVALYNGMGDVARRYGLVIAGGDIVRSPFGLALHITALGELQGEQRLTRGGARPGDIIGVTGTLGASAAGMHLLAGEAAPRRAATADLLIQAHLRPEPRVPLGEVLREQGASAAMDLSDGLMGDLPKILAASNVSAEIDLRELPVAAAVRALFPEQWLALATRGGEDYELLFTVPESKWDAMREALNALGGQVQAIGRILSADGAPSISVIGLDGIARPESPGAFDHFAQGN